eukprot:TRINITY_DN32836_c0_g1_i2.p1 TRINITY_DN32836_c0_g1~~TRINITY_DN32836_c0_g1_i2.p1  ORF type:complete len:301 (-),score=54.51 TRINITY_DN32836_c0_g1_i2:443-1345(-)
MRGLAPVLALVLAMLVTAQELPDDEGTCLLQAKSTLLGGLEHAQTVVQAVQLASQSAQQLSSNAFVNATPQLSPNRTAMTTELRKTSEKENQKETGEADKPYADFIQFLAFLLLFSVAAVLYEAFRNDKEMNNAKARSIEWDAVRLIVQMIVILGHMEMFQRIDLESSTTFNPLEHDMVWQMSRLSDFREFVFFMYSGTFRMPAFAFISGVFGQKVDRLTLARVVCYTWGTGIMMRIVTTFVLHKWTDVTGMPTFADIWYVVTALPAWYLHHHAVLDSRHPCPRYPWRRSRQEMRSILQL